jgi:hypothetical protein
MHFLWPLIFDSAKITRHFLKERFKNHLLSKFKASFKIQMAPTNHFIKSGGLNALLYY